MLETLSHLLLIIIENDYLLFIIGEKMNPRLVLASYFSWIECFRTKNV